MRGNKSRQTRIEVAENCFKKKMKTLPRLILDWQLPRHVKKYKAE